MARILPNILTNDIDELKALLSEASVVGDRVQIDIIDGEFADNVTVDPGVFTSLKTNLKLDYHLMVIDPQNWIAKCANASGDRVLGQVEKIQSQLGFVKKVKKWDMKAGLVLDLNTPAVGEIDGEVYPEVDAIQVMSVPAGFGGQKFNESAIDKIVGLDKLRKKDSLNFSIIADGGITPAVVEDLIQAGVDEIGIGNRLLQGDSKENIKKFTDELERIERKKINGRQK